MYVQFLVPVPSVSKIKHECPGLQHGCNGLLAQVFRYDNAFDIEAFSSDRFNLSIKCNIWTWLISIDSVKKSQITQGLSWYLHKLHLVSSMVPCFCSNSVSCGMVWSFLMPRSISNLPTLVRTSSMTSFWDTKDLGHGYSVATKVYCGDLLREKGPTIYIYLQGCLTSQVVQDFWTINSMNMKTTVFLLDCTLRLP